MCYILAEISASATIKTSRSGSVRVSICIKNFPLYLGRESKDCQALSVQIKPDFSFCKERRKQNMIYLSVSVTHLCFKQVQPKMCHSPKVDDGVDI